MGPIGVVVACLPEADCLVSAPRPGVHLAVHDHVLLHVCGIGPARAAAAAAQLADAGATGLLSVGTAGGLSPALDPGAVLLPAHVATDAGRLPTHVAWRTHARATLAAGGITTLELDLAESGHVVATADAKAALAGRHGAAAVDMESAAVLRVAAARRLPALVVRVVMDGADVAMPEFLLARTDAYGRSHLPGLLLDLLGNPARLPALLRVSRTFNRARTSLRAVGRQLHALHPGHDALTPDR